MHEFVIKDKGQLVTYTEYEAIPNENHHVIKFLPEVPPEPHTEEQHEEIEQWNIKLQELMKKERSYASSN